MTLESPRFHFRPLAEDDLPMLFDWLNRPHVAEHWRGEVSVDEVREKYLPRIAGADAARPFLAELDGEPVGYVQVYDCGAVPGWWPDDPGPGILGTDQFLALGDRLDQGLGTAMVRQLVDLLMQDPTVTEVRVDPHPDNGRAIRCYEKAGFRAVREITTPDGAALWMVRERGARRGADPAPGPPPP